MGVKELKNFLKKKGIEADFYEFSEPTLSVEDSARQLEISPNRIVKSLIFKDRNDNPVLAIISGNKRVDENILSKAHGSEVRMAKAREVENFTGYKIGEVPPVSHDIKTFMDTGITDYETVIAGGGSTHTLIELDPEDIVDVTGAELVDIGEN